VKNILITGAYGFIASNLIRSLENKNNFNLYSIGTNTKNSSINIKTHKHIESPINIINLETLCDNELPDVIVHCAGIGTVLDASDILKSQKSMIETSEAVFSYAKQNKINKVIFLSSAAVYGNSLLKKSQRLNPLSDYGRLKKDCEDLFLSMKDAHTTPIILRLFSVYGPNLRKQLIYDAFNKFSKQKEPMFRGDGNQIRDFIHINDVIEVIKYYILEKNISNQIIQDVGTGIETKIKDLIYLISQQYLANHKIEKQYIFDDIVDESDPLFQVANKDIQNLMKKNFIKINDGVIEYANNFYINNKT
jgi:nucleoside-diphosphate-sugar epimerase